MKKRILCSALTFFGVLLLAVSVRAQEEAPSPTSAKTVSPSAPSPVTKEKAPKPALQGIIVWRLEAKNGVQDKDIDSLSGYIASEVERLSGQKVISEADIRTILKGEEARQKCGAEDTGCVAEVGAALGVPEAVSGDLGRLGDYWMLNLRRLNVRKAEVLKRATRKVHGDINALIEVLPGIMAELFDKPEPAAPPLPAPPPPNANVPAVTGKLEVTAEPVGATLILDGKTKGRTPFAEELQPGMHTLEIRQDGYTPQTHRVLVKPQETTHLALSLRRVYPMSPYKKAAYASFFTGVGLVAFGGIATWQAKSTAEHVKTTGRWNSEASSRAWMGGAISAYALGGAGMIAGVALWLLAPGDEAWWKAHSLSAGPAAGGQGAVLQFGGRW